MHGVRVHSSFIDLHVAVHLTTEKKIMDLEKRLVVAKGQGQGEGVGWIGSLGFIDADYCLCNG